MSNFNSHAKRIFTATLAVACLASLLAASIYFFNVKKQHASLGATPPPPPPAGQSKAREAYGKLPMSFEVNKGQTDAQVKFLARGAGYSLFLTPTEAVFSLKEANKEQDNEEASGRKSAAIENQNLTTTAAVVRMKLAGANAEARVAGQEQLPGKSNYFVGKDKRDWHTNVSSYAKVRYEGVYPGVDMVYYGNQRRLEYDFVIAPHADPKVIGLDFSGVKDVKIDESGELVLNVAGREIRQLKPFAYQEVEGKRQEIASRYVIDESNQVKFDLGHYDTSKPLVIDPVLVYGTYFGGTGNETAVGIAVNSAGEAFITGSTSSLTFPSPALPLQNATLDLSDAFVLKINAAGNGIVYASYFGGDNMDFAGGIALDQSGNAYVAGTTHSSNFPIAGMPFQSAKSGGNPLFKSTDGSDFGSGVQSGSATGLTTANVSSIAVHPTDPSIVFATPFTGAAVYKSTDGGATWAVSNSGLPDLSMNDIVFDRANPDNLYAAACGATGGVYRSTDGGATWVQTTVRGACMNTIISAPNGTIYAGGFDGLGVWKSTDGVMWTNTSVGDSVSDIAIDPHDATAQTLYIGTGGSGVFKSPDGGATWNPTALTGPGYTSDHSLSADPANSQTLYTVVDGQLKKTADGGASWATLALPVSAGSYPTSTLVTPTALYVGTTQNGVFKSTDGGGSWVNALPSAGSIHGLVSAPSNPNQIYAEVLTGSEGFVAKLSADGSSLLYSTYLGGGLAGQQFTADDTANAIAVDASGNAYITGQTAAANFPMQNPTQPGNGGFVDAFVSKLDSTGTNLLFSTYVGGGGNEIGRGIAIAPDGGVYVAGNTVSGNFPVLNAAQPVHGTAGGNDGFLVRFNSGGAYTVGFSTFIGGASGENANGVAVDNAGNAYVVGQSNTGGLATPGAAQTVKGRGADAFLTKFDQSGVKVYFTYIGGSSNSIVPPDPLAAQASQDIGTGVAVDGMGNAYVTGYTRSDGFPLNGKLIRPVLNISNCGALKCFDAFVTKINPAGSARSYSTLLGGEGNDQPSGIAVRNGAVYATGTTSSAEPMQSGAIQNVNGGGTDAIVLKLATATSPDATDLSVSMTDSPDPVAANSNLTYTVTVTNGGEADVTGVTLTDTLPASATLVSTSVPCTGTTTLNCNLGDLAATQSMSVTVVVKPTQTGSAINTVSVAGAQAEANTSNNSATQTTTVTVGNVFTVTNTNDSGPGSLRAALAAADADQSKDTILFNIAPGGVQTITPLSQLFANSPVFIDGTSQPGFLDKPLIVLSGASGVQMSGLHFSSDNGHVRGLVLNGFFYAGISTNGSNTVIEGNFIGTDATGNVAVPNGTGVDINAGTNNLVGGTTQAARNVIGGNRGNGIGIQSAATGTKIKGNYIGLRADGTGALPQPNWTPGVGLYSTSGTIVGGTEAGARNVISGNKGPGVWIATTYPSGPGSVNNSVQGNLIGTMPDGNSALINEGGGIGIVAGSNNNTIGGMTQAARNVIAGGVNLDSATANRIQGNYIGLKADGSARIISTGWAGVQLRGSSGNFIGGDTPGAGNVISGNAGPGIWIVNTCTECNPPQPNVLSTNNYVQGNLIGTNPAGTAAIPNTNNGIGIERGSTGNIIGGASALARNVISGNTGEGVNIHNGIAPADGNTIQGNYIGTDITGTLQIANMNNGVGIYGVSNTQVIGNVISGNNSGGITIGSGRTASNQPLVGANGTQVLGNFIGTNATGTAIIRNTYHGVSINGGSTGNRIGGTAPGSRNVITGNGGNGVDINSYNGSSNGNFVQGNYIGTDITGVTVLMATVNNQPFYGNGSGVGISGSSNTLVGGTDPLARNVIAGNNCQGVNIGSADNNGVITQASNNLVQGNYIGLNKDGTGYLTNPNGAAFGQKCSGVFIAGGTNNTVGGTTPGAGNVIGGSQHQGVVISSINSFIGTGNKVQGNIIGTNVAMTTPLANGIGVFLINGSSNNTIGGDDDDDGTLDGVVRAGNTIVGNTSDGVNIQSAFLNGANVIATGNAVQGNRIGVSVALRNGNSGVNLGGAANNTIGGTTPGAGNEITFNNNNGIALNCPTINGATVCSVGNQIQQNSIHSNSNFGIRFNQGANGAFPHNNQPAPVINFAVSTSGGTSVQGTLAGTGGVATTLEFFSNDACDSTGAGEGATYIGSLQVTTDASGTTNFTASLPTAVVVGKVITATAANASNGTSSFSQCSRVNSATANITGRITDEGNAMGGVTVTLSGAQSATTTTDAGGNYSFPNLPSDATYSLSASLTGHTFSPESWNFDKLRGNQVANFTKRRVQYTITDLGTLGGTHSFGIGLNESGQVVGRSQMPGNTTTHGFLYSNGTMTDLGTFGGNNSDVRAINDSGKVVGDANATTNPLNRAFVYFNGTKTLIGTFGGNSFGRGINNAGQIAGYSDLPNNGGARAFRTSANGVLNPATDNLGTLPGGTFSQGLGINEAGHVVGISGVAGSFSRAFLYNGSAMLDLGTLGGNNSFAFYVNDADVAVGRSEFAPGNIATRAAVYNNGTVTDLGTLGGNNSSANSINNSNIVVGHSEFNSGNQLPFIEAFVYKDGVMVNLNARIQAGSGWTSLTTAQGINDVGQITGYGVFNGQTHAFLLTPTTNTKTAQTVTFDNPPISKVYGDAPFAVSATASSSLSVTYSVAGPATINGNSITITGAGTITVTATQAGDDTYESATATHTINVAKKLLTVMADGKTRLYGAPAPAFTASYLGFVNGDSSASLGGALTFATSATSNSAVGTYTIMPGGLASNNYQIAYNPGTLTIDKASTSTTSANYEMAVPGSVNLLAQVAADAPSAQSVTGGTVTFVIRQGTTNVATITSGQVTNGQATATYNVANGGAYTIYASYSGNGNYTGSTGLASLTIGNANPVPSITGLLPESTIKKATETGQFTLLIDGSGFMSTQSGDPANSTVDWYDRTTGQHTNLSITSITGAQIQAVVPFTLIRDGKTVEVSVINAGPGGGTSNAQPFFITDTAATVTSAETVIPDPVSGTASTTSVTSTGAVLSAEASSGGAAGSGTLTVAQYSEDPIGNDPSTNTSAFSAAGSDSYFDVYVAPGSSFTSLALDYCNTGGTTLYWWNGTTWNLVSNQTYNPGTQCITVTVTTTSSPSIAQLTGTVFGVASGPAVNSITVTPSTVALGSGSAVTINSSFTDMMGSGPYTAEIIWGDGQITNLANVTGTMVTSAHTYSTAGTYTVKVKVARGDAFGTSTFSPVVVYNPSAGFLTGGGWFNSPLGALPDNPGFTGKVHFETSAKYESGNGTPTGMTKVSLPGMSFTATKFSYLSVLGTKVQTGGMGTINGTGSYGFLLTGTDGKLEGKKQPDKVRVKIWNLATGQVVYDNQIGATDDAAAILALGGGNITIHK